MQDAMNEIWLYLSMRDTVMWCVCVCVCVCVYASILLLGTREMARFLHTSMCVWQSRPYIQKYVYIKIIMYTCKDGQYVHCTPVLVQCIVCFSYILFHAVSFGFICFFSNLWIIQSTVQKLYNVWQIRYMSLPSKLGQCIVGLNFCFCTDNQKRIYCSDKSWRSLLLYQDLLPQFHIFTGNEQ